MLRGYAGIPYTSLVQSAALPSHKNPPRSQPLHSVADNMATRSKIPTAFDRDLEREKDRHEAQLRRHAQGGKHTDLSDRLALHNDPYPTKARCLCPTGKHEKPSSKKETPPSNFIKLGPTRAPVTYTTTVKTSSSSSSAATQPPPPPKDIIQEEVLKEGGSDIHCPFHAVLCDHKVSPKGFAYVKCPVQPCVFFCAEEDAHEWSTKLKEQASDDYKIAPQSDLTAALPFHCLCGQSPYDRLKLKRSRTEKNPGRFCLMCPHSGEGCCFFGWVDSKAPYRLLEAWGCVPEGPSFTLDERGQCVDLPRSAPWQRAPFQEPIPLQRSYQTPRYQPYPRRGRYY